MTQLEELKSKLVVHIDALHLDAQEHSDLVDDAGELAAEAKLASRRKQLEYEEVKAASDKEVRLFPEKFGLAKTTEPSIKAAVTLHPDVHQAYIDMIEADRDTDLANALKDAFHHRKAMLQIEAQLYHDNYWGEVDVKERSMNKVRESGTKQIEEQLKRERRRKA